MKKNRKEWWYYHYLSFIDLFIALAIYLLQKIVLQFTLQVECADQMIVLVLGVSVDSVFVLLLWLFYSSFHFSPYPSLPLLAYLSSFSIFASHSKIFKMIFKIKLFLLFHFLLLVDLPLLILYCFSDENALINWDFSIASLIIFLFRDSYYFINTRVHWWVLIPQEAVVDLLFVYPFVFVTIFFEIIDFLFNALLTVQNHSHHLHSVSLTSYNSFIFSSFVSFWSSFCWLMIFVTPVYRRGYLSTAGW